MAETARPSLEADGSVSTEGGPPPPDDSVLQRGHDVFSRATFTTPGLTATTAATMAPDVTFDMNATFPMNGNTTGQGNPSVLYLEQGPAAAGCPAGATGCKATTRPAGNGLFFAFAPLQATPNVFAFDETTGQPVWTALATNGGPNGGNDGIRGTPAIDPVSRRVFVVTGNGPHMVHAISVDNGVEVTTGGWPVTLAKNTVTYNATGFDSAVQNQRGALLLVNNTLYIPFGGEDGDGGNYLGWIISIDITNPAHLAGWATAGQKAGIWASGGLAADGAGSVFAATGNAPGPSRPGSDSEEIVRVTGMSAFTRSAANVFVANEWNDWDSNDRDFSSCSPAYTPLPAGSTPAGVVIAPAKPGRIYFLDATNLSQGKYDPTSMVNTNGQLAELTVSNTTSESIYTSPTVYSTASGLHTAINVGGGAMNCPTAVTGNEAIVSVLLTPGATFGAKVAWCAAVGSGGGKMNFPPISTTSDGVSADPIVWFLAGSQLKAVNGDTGAAIVTTTGAACNTIPSQSFPIAVKNRIVVFALGHLCSWSPGGN